MRNHCALKSGRVTAFFVLGNRRNMPFFLDPFGIPMYNEQWYISAFREKGVSVLYAQVIVDIVHENVAHTFTYRIPDGMTLTAGQRVEVPFGRMRKEGVVLSLTQETDVPPEKLPRRPPPAGGLCRYLPHAADARPADGGRRALPTGGNAAADAARPNARWTHSGENADGRAGREATRNAGSGGTGGETLAETASAADGLIRRADAPGGGIEAARPRAAASAAPDRSSPD